MSKFLRKKKGQAAVEFLTTYGWAIIGVFVVVGALSYFGFLDTTRFVLESCDTGSQLQCKEMYVNNQGDFEIALRNNYPVNLNIEEIWVDKVRVFNSNSSKLSSGNAASFLVNVGPQNKDIKKNFDVIIQFSRDGPGAVRSYNTSGIVVVKVHDISQVPLPEYNASSCGDGIQAIDEECDTTSTRTCSSFTGFTGDYVVHCNHCFWDKSGCLVSNICGNGIVENGEDCEIGQTTSCSVQGFSGDPSTVNCLGCHWDTSVCSSSSVCGNYILENGEECDTSSTRACSEFPGLTGSYVVQCNYCSWNTSGCTVSSSCGDPNAVCSPGQTTSCDALDLPGGTIPVNCGVDCNWDTGDCIGIFLTQCSKLSQCKSSEICISTDGVVGYCEPNCDSFNGKLCTLGVGLDFNHYGICTWTSVSKTSSSCDTNVAANSSNSIYASCSGMSNGVSCDSGSLAGGFTQNGACINYNCGTLKADGETCLRGTDCQGGFCVGSGSQGMINGLSICASNCSSNGKLCSNTSARYSESGICTWTSASKTSSICDKDTAAVKTVESVDYYFNDCTSAPDLNLCMYGSLVGGFVANSKCISQVCENPNGVGFVI